MCDEHDYLGPDEVVECPDCNGTGVDDDGDTCGYCAGTGFVGK